MCLYYTLDSVYILCYTNYGGKAHPKEEITMPMKYDKLFTLMKEKGLTTYRIRKEKIISEGTLQKLRENKPVTTDSIAALCEVLCCQPGDIMEYIPEGQ